MGCGCSSKSSSSGSSYTPTPVVQTCEYSLIKLNELLLVAAVNESNIVQSQINIYNSNCNMFRNVIVPLFTKYDISLT